MEEVHFHKTLSCKFWNYPDEVHFQDELLLSVSIALHWQLIIGLITEVNQTARQI